MGEVIRVIVVDDEGPARTRLLELLEKQSDCKVVGVARNGKEAIQLIESESPDLQFLDVQMPGMDGFAVLHEIEPQSIPFTIFVTAYDKYALQAFEAHALDYLLKPFSDERFESALQRARQVIRTHQAGELSMRLVGLLEGSSGRGNPSAYLERIGLRSRDRITFVAVRDIDWIEAAGVYVYLHVGGRKHIHRATVGQLELRLDPNKFVRIHRSTIVNTERIRELKSRSHGDFSLVLKDDTEITLSRGYRPRLDRWLNKSL